MRSTLVFTLFLGAEAVRVSSTSTVNLKRIGLISRKRTNTRISFIILLNLENRLRSYYSSYFYLDLQTVDIVASLDQRSRKESWPDTVQEPLVRYKL